MKGAALLGACVAATLALWPARAAAQSVPVTYHGGPILARPVVEDIVLTGTLAYEIDAAVIVENPGFLINANPYGVGPGVFNGADLLGVWQGPIALSTIGAFVDALHGDWAGVNLTVVELPTGTMVTQPGGAPVTAGAAHGVTAGGLAFAYVVATPGTPEFTLLYSHELVEAAVDPDGHGWFAGSPNGGEVADLCGVYGRQVAGLYVTRFMSDVFGPWQCD